MVRPCSCSTGVSPVRSRCCLAEERVEQTFGGARDHMAANEFASLLGGLSASFHGGPNAADVATHNRGDQSAADANSLHNLHVGGLRHRIGRFDQADEALCFN